MCISFIANIKSWSLKVLHSLLLFKFLQFFSFTDHMHQNEEHKHENYNSNKKAREKV